VSGAARNVGTLQGPPRGPSSLPTTYGLRSRHLLITSYSLLPQPPINSAIRDRYTATEGWVLYSRVAASPDWLPASSRAGLLGGLRLHWGLSYSETIKGSSRPWTTGANGQPVRSQEAPLGSACYNQARNGLDGTLRHRFRCVFKIAQTSTAHVL
jgi:hypothetical protein